MRNPWAAEEGVTIYATHDGQQECVNCRQLPEDCSGKGLKRKCTTARDDGRSFLRKRLDDRKVDLDHLEHGNRKDHMRIANEPSLEPQEEQPHFLDPSLLLLQVTLLGSIEIPTMRSRLEASV